MTIDLRERNRLAAMDEVRRVAFEQMVTKGFDAVTVEQIAAASNVSPSTVYRYFGTKEALVLSTRRPSDFVERVAADESRRSPLESCAKAAAKIWGGDDSARVELDLVLANPSLRQAWERQILDQREPLERSLASRRGSPSSEPSDSAQAAAAVAILAMVLPTWSSGDGGKKILEKSLNDAFTALS